MSRIGLNATIYNLLNKDFKDYQSYIRYDNGNTAWSNRYNNILEPRRLWVSLNVDF